MKIWKIGVVAVVVCIFTAGSAYADNGINFNPQGTPALSISYDGVNDNGVAILGEAVTETDTPTYGIVGTSASSMGVGVLGDSPYIGVRGTGRYAGIMGETNTSVGSAGVYGKAKASNPDEGFFTFGVYGENSNAKGFGISGYNDYPTGETYGVYGLVASPDGYGVYSFGNAKVEGDLTVTGAIKGNLKVDGAVNSVETNNLAKNATATASSQYNDTYAASKINDGIYGRWDEGEWASLGEKAGAWIQLNWAAPVKFSKIMLHPRPNKYDQIYDASLLIMRADGATTDLHLGQFSNGGAPKEIHLKVSEGTDVIAVQVYITETSQNTLNIGLAEIETYYDPKLWE